MTQPPELTRLVERVRQGDQEAWNDLYLAVAPRALTLARSTGLTEADAQDAVQDSTITAMQKIGTQSDPEKFVGWFLTIVKNRCRDKMRKCRPMAFSEVGPEDNGMFDNWEDDRPGIDPQLRLENSDLQRIMGRILLALPDEQRAALNLYYGEGLDVQEIAQLQGVSTGTVKSRLNYARKKVKEQVELEERLSGVTLHGLAPAVLLTLSLRTLADTTLLPASLAAAGGLAGGAAAGAAAAGGAAGSGSAAGGSAAGSAAGASHTAGSAAAAAAKGGGKAVLSARAVAGGLAAVAVGGTVAYTQIAPRNLSYYLKYDQKYILASTTDNDTFNKDYQTVLTFHRNKTVDGAQLWGMLDYKPTGSGTGDYEGSYLMNGTTLVMQMTYTDDGGAVSTEEWRFEMSRKMDGSAVLTLLSADGPIRTRQGGTYYLVTYP